MQYSSWLIVLLCWRHRLTGWEGCNTAEGETVEGLEEGGEGGHGGGGAQGRAYGGVLQRWAVFMDR